MAGKLTTKAVGAGEGDQRFSELAKAFAADKRVTAGKMFASYGLKVSGKIFAMIYKGDLVVKLPKKRVDELIASSVASHFHAGKGKPMKEWAVIADRRSNWAGLVREAFDFVRSLR